MSIKNGESPNVEGAPTLVYELWSWPEERPAPMYYDVDFSKNNWHFHGYIMLSLRQVLKYQEFGYHVERSFTRDRNGTLPLFPRLDSATEDPGNGLDPVPLPEP